jgi:hypothetical protein
MEFAVQPQFGNLERAHTGRNCAELGARWASLVGGLGCFTQATGVVAEPSEDGAVANSDHPT